MNSQWFIVHAKNVKLTEDVDFAKRATRTPRFTEADLAKKYLLSDKCYYCHLLLVT